MLKIQEITSLRNPHVKAVVDLRERRVRDEKSLMIVEGVREISLARQAGVVFSELYFEQSFFDAQDHQEFIKAVSPQSKDIFLLPEYVFEKMTFGHRHEGVLGVCVQPKKSLREIKLSSRPLVVVVESVEKPGNLGAILRTADAVGADGLVVCDPATDMYNPNVIRSSLGAVFSVDVAAASKEDALKYFKENNMTVCATLPQAGQCYAHADLRGPLALVMGSEEKGLSEFWQKKCDVAVYIPMKGKVDSLNVSVSAAVILYEIIRQRGI